MTERVRVAAWWLLFLAIGWACVGSLVDRLARQGLLVDAPPALLGGGSATMARAWAAYRRSDPTAWEWARAAVARRPVDAPALRVAGFAAVARGDAARGDALLRLAGSAGWRDVPTQLFWAETALAGGEPAVAILRAEAVLRTGDGAAAKPLLRRIEAMPATRAALLDRWRALRPWRDWNAWYAPHLLDIDGLDAAALAERVALIVEARETGRAPDGPLLDALGWRLIEGGRPDLAWRLSRRRPGQWLEGFDHTLERRRPGPFAWAPAAGPGMEAAMVWRDGAVLHVRAGGSTLVAAASQLVMLPAGPARLTGRVEGARTTLPLLATLTCLKGAEVAAETLSPPPGHFAARFAVPAGCPIQRLVLAVTGEEAERDPELWISDVALTPGGP